MRVSRAQRERCGADILRRDRVSDIDQNRSWTARQNNSLHGTDEVVLRSEVGQKSDDPDRHNFRLKWQTDSASTTSTFVPRFDLVETPDKKPLRCSRYR